jgi:hypothetical protein
MTASNFDFPAMYGKLGSLKRGWRAQSGGAASKMTREVRGVASTLLTSRTAGGIDFADAASASKSLRP